MHWIKKVIIALLAILIIVLILYYSRIDSKVNNIPGNDRSIIDISSEKHNGTHEVLDKDKIIKELEKKQLIVTDKLSSGITFESNKAYSRGDIIFENLNTNKVIMQFEIFIDSELIAVSPALFPGEYIDKVRLLKDFNEKATQGLLYINYYGISDKKYLGRACYSISIKLNNQ